MKQCTENAIFYTFLGEMIAKHAKKMAEIQTIFVVYEKC